MVRSLLTPEGKGWLRLYLFERKSGLPIPMLFPDDEERWDLFSQAQLHISDITRRLEELFKAAGERHGLEPGADWGEFGQDLKRILFLVPDEEEMLLRSGIRRIFTSGSGWITLYALGEHFTPRLFVIRDAEGKLDQVTSVRMVAPDKKEAIVLDFSPEDYPGYTEVRYELFDYTARKVSITRKFYEPGRRVTARLTRQDEDMKGGT